jgi:hypothetical protein
MSRGEQTDKRSRVGLVGCVKLKQSGAAPAKDLYVSPLFRLRRAYVERSCGRWFILSAKHGLVEPGNVLEPYDESLGDAPRASRLQWSERVHVQLASRLGDLRRYTFELHAGASYTDSGLAAALLKDGAKVENPTAGLGLGKQLGFYRRATFPTE